MKDLAQIDGAIEWLGVQYKTILSAEQTGGTMSIVDSWSPAGSGPPASCAFERRRDLRDPHRDLQVLARGR